MKNVSKFSQTVFSVFMFSLAVAQFSEAKELQLTLKLGEPVKNCLGDQIIVKGSTLAPLQVKENALLAVWHDQKETQYCLGWCYSESLCFNKPTVTRTQTAEGTFLTIKGEPVVSKKSKPKTAGDGKGNGIIEEASREMPKDLLNQVKGIIGR